MDLDQRARRVTKRRNNQLARRFPLFATLFAESVEENRERLLCQEQENQVYFERLRQKSLHAYQRGEEHRQVVMQVLSDSELDELDRQLRSWHNLDAEVNGEFYADFWWMQVCRRVPEYAHAHCPNERYHSLPGWCGSIGHCLTCGKKID